MKAVKGNREYIIDETQKKGYQDSGFDILDEDGKMLAYGRGKTVAYSEYAAAINEIERLQALVKEQSIEIEALRIKTAQEPAKKAESKKAGE